VQDVDRPAHVQALPQPPRRGGSRVQDNPLGIVLSGGIVRVRAPTSSRRPSASWRITTRLASHAWGAPLK